MDQSLELPSGCLRECWGGSIVRDNFDGGGRALWLEVAGVYFAAKPLSPGRRDARTKLDRGHALAAQHGGDAVQSVPGRTRAPFPRTLPRFAD